jgi:hypothetical protein
MSFLLGFLGVIKTKEKIHFKEWRKAAVRCYKATV